MIQKTLIKTIIKWFIILSLIILAFTFILKPEVWQSLKNIDLYEAILILSITQLIYVISGIEYSLIVWFNSQIRLSIKDIVLLPVTMNLWSFIIPFQGAIIYSSVFLKYKYKTKLNQAVSVSLFSYLISIILTGFFGILYSFINRIFNFFTLICLVLFCFPFFLYLLEKFIKLLKFKRFSTIEKFLTFIADVIINLRELFFKRKLIIVILFTNIFHISTSIVWNLVISKALGIEIGLGSLIIYTLLLRLSIILKITPGNIGIQELLSGGLFSLMALNPAQGILISLVGRLFSMILMLTVGIIDTIENTKYFQINKLFNYKERSN